MLRISKPNKKFDQSNLEFINHVVENHSLDWLDMDGYGETNFFGKVESKTIKDGGSFINIDKVDKDSEEDIIVFLAGEIHELIMPGDWVFVRGYKGIVNIPYEMVILYPKEKEAYDNGKLIDREFYTVRVSQGRSILEDLKYLEDN